MRVTDSGLGCPDWPLCDGRIIPVFERAPLVEFSHRLVGSVVGLLSLAVAVLAVRHRRAERSVLLPSVVGAASRPRGRSAGCRRRLDGARMVGEAHPPWACPGGGRLHGRRHACRLAGRSGRCARGRTLPRVAQGADARIGRGYTARHPVGLVHGRLWRQRLVRHLAAMPGQSDARRHGVRHPHGPPDAVGDGGGCGPWCSGHGPAAGNTQARPVDGVAGDHCDGGSDAPGRLDGLGRLHDSHAGRTPRRRHASLGRRGWPGYALHSLPGEPASSRPSPELAGAGGAAS